MLLSTPMPLEYEAVCKGQLHLDAARLQADGLVARAERIYRRRPQLRDADDELVLEAAANRGAKTLVT